MLRGKAELSTAPTVRSNPSLFKGDFMLGSGLTCRCIALLTLAPFARAQGLLEHYEGGVIDAQLGIKLSSAGDMDGDGREDYALVSVGSSSGFGRVSIYSGATRQLIYVFQGLSLNESLGRSIAPVGDLDGDGHDELLLGSPNAGRVTVVSGAAGDTVWSVSNLPTTGSGLGWSVAPLGDVNADGVADVAASASAASPGYLFYLSGVDGAVIRTIPGAHSNEYVGETIAGGADFDGDGVGDVAARGRAYGSTPDHVRLYSGATGAIIRTLPAPSASAQFGATLCVLPDLDGDLRPDVAVGSPQDSAGGSSAGSVRIFSSQTGAELRAIIGNSGENLGFALDTIADVDGDGLRDLLVAGAKTNVSPGFVRVLSSASGAELLRYRSWSGHSPQGVAGLGDLDLDGSPEFLVANLTQSRVYLVTTGVSSGASYCVAKVSSNGCVPAIGGTGTPAFSGPDDFHITCSQTTNLRNGFAFWGRAHTGSIFLGGTLCVASPMLRTPVQFSGGSSSGVDCTGTFDFHFSNAFAQQNGVLPGELLSAQYWMRDPGYSPPSNAGLSDAWSWIHGQ